MEIIRRNSTDVWPAFFGDIFGKDWLNTEPQLTNSFPAVNIKEDEQGYLLELVVPGMNKKDFNIQLDESELTISYEKKAEKAEEKETYSRREFEIHSFKRTFALPETADHQKIGASYQDGILSLSIPKKEEDKKKQPRSIKVG